MFVVDFTDGKTTIPQIFDALEDDAPSVKLLVAQWAKDGFVPVKGSKREIPVRWQAPEPQGVEGFKARFLDFKRTSAFIIDRRSNG